VACAEDVELSYRLANLGCKMVFNPKARVIHRHPASLGVYLRKKFKFAYWRMLSLKKHPNKILVDSHTPQFMKLQLLLSPALVATLLLAVISPGLARLTFGVFLLALLTTIPFVTKAISRDPIIGCLAPLFLILRSGAQFLGVSWGILNNMMPRSIQKS
jgi:GT2 family glycosyltransferase